MPLESTALPDSLAAWIRHYTQFAITGVRSKAVAQKVVLHPIPRPFMEH